jgi:quinoprotein relay system zinc metallohydrolase 2
VRAVRVRFAAAMIAAAALLWSLGSWGGPAELPELALENPSPGVYIHYGQQAEMTPENFGDIANVGFVVGAKCVAVIDTGGTYAVGRALRNAIRRVTAAPVCYVINTHVHPDHIFGNQAFVADHPEYLGHAHLAEAMQRRGPNYLHALQRDLGSRAEGTTLVFPTRSVTAGERLDLGNRSLNLRAWQTAHTDTDLTVLDEQSGTLWLGDLLFVGHIPVLDGSLRGFIAVVDELKNVRAQRVIPGHGRASAWPAAIIAEDRYFEQLQVDVRAALAAKMSLAQAVDTVDYDRSGGWLLADRFHRRNVTAAYAELEWAQ